MESQNQQFINQYLAMGYEKEQIYAYLSSKKTSGELLENWAIDELICSMEEFVHNNPIAQEKYNYPPMEEYKEQNIPSVPSMMFAYGNRSQEQQLEKAKQSEVESTPTPNLEKQEQQPQQQLQSNQEYPPQSQADPNAMRRQTTSTFEVVYEKLRQSQQFLYQPEPLDPRSNVKSIPCKILRPPNPNSILLSKNLTVQITQSLQKSGGLLFKKEFTTFVIQLSGNGRFLSVERRYSDFDTLKDYLNKSFPEFLIPPIPKKTSKNKNADTIEYRMALLDQFCKRLLEMAELRYDAYVDQFFTEKEFNTKYKVTRVVDPRYINTIEGQATIAVGPFMDSYYNQRNILNDQLDSQYARIRKLAGKVIEENQNIQGYLIEISKCYVQIHDLHKQFNISTTYGRNQSIETINSALSNMFQLWSAKLDEQNKHIQNHIKHFYKYQKLEFVELKELLKTRESFSQEFLKSQGKLDAKKEKLFKDQNIQKMDIPKEAMRMYSPQQILSNQALAFSLMLPSETNVTQLMHNNFGYYNYHIYNQLRYQEHCYVKQVAINFLQFAQKQQHVEKNSQIWDLIANNFMNLGQT